MVAACSVIRLLTIKFLSALFNNVTPLKNFNVEFLKIAMSEPIVSIEQA